jgi:hypothetical protein
MTGLLALAVGHFLGPEFRRDGGEVDPDPLPGVALLDEGAALMGMGATAAAGLIISWEWPWLSPGKQLRWLLEESTPVSEAGENGE